MPASKQQWEWTISPATSWHGTSLRELYHYKDLLFGLVRKDFISAYQQTLLGPVWVVVNPLLSVFIYMFLFDRVIGVSTGQTPPFLFYLAGITLWNMFSGLYTATASIITSNSGLFNKVYFPRIITPLAAILTTLLKFAIQLLFLFIASGYYFISGKVAFAGLNILLLLPSILLIVLIAGGLGLISSVITAKYRDMSSAFQLFLRLGMFVTPVLFSVSKVPEAYAWIVQLNPLSASFEWFRMAITGQGMVSGESALVSISLSLMVMIAGYGLYNKMTENLIDVA